MFIQVGKQSVVSYLSAKKMGAFIPYSSIIRYLFTAVSLVCQRPAHF